MPKKKLELTDAERAAQAAKLVYVSDTEPGISRRKRGQHFHISM